MIYQDPLAYLLGLEGIALLDAWAGDHDRAFTEARLAEKLGWIEPATTAADTADPLALQATTARLSQ